MLFCAARANDVSRVTKAMRALDSDAFIVVTETAAILGEGFRKKAENL